MKTECILFDLDGTLADTSVDMCNALNKVLTKYKFKNVDCSGLKTHISKGAVGIIDYASVINQRSIDSSLLRSEFLQEYSENTFIYTKMINGMEKLLEYIEKNNIKWGIVTNKHSKYVKKILEGFALSDRVKCLVTGDMLQETKPNPEGLLLAANILNVNLNETIYVGDDERDIIAGKNAGMKTVAADFGFVNKDYDIFSWNADRVIKKPMMLKDFLI